MMTAILAVLFLQLVILGKVIRMSASDRLNAAASAAVSKIKSLESEVVDLNAEIAALKAAPAGTPDEVLDAVSAELEAAVSPPVAPAEPAPSPAV